MVLATGARSSSLNDRIDDSRCDASKKLGKELVCACLPKVSRSVNDLIACKSGAGSSIDHADLTNSCSSGVNQLPKGYAYLPQRIVANVRLAVTPPPPQSTPGPPRRGRHQDRRREGLGAGIDREVLALPETDECVVVGLPSEVGDQKVAAAPVLSGQGRACGEPMDLARLRRVPKSRIVAYKMPQDVEIADALSRNAMGKINKKQLRAQRLR
ncbi:uncharacterized protein PG986_008708 [Apiospora aurea]|uniref:AMP-binding enzyme C-terminal domain-containing protein n=1 Tax=Apiospora aurea TaxID=335848 RepID=A0ABR1Q5H8_9PEZI